MRGFITVTKNHEEIVLVNINCIAAVEPFPTTDEDWGETVIRRGENGATILMTGESGLEDLLSCESYPEIIRLLEEATTPSFTVIKESEE